MTKDQLVEQAISHFSRWRATRLNQKEPTPKALKLRAVGLLDSFSKGQVCDLLHLNPSSLSLWQRELGEANEASPFVQLPALIDEVSSNENDKEEDLNLTLTLHEGKTLTLSGDLSHALVLSIVKALLP